MLILFYTSFFSYLFFLYFVLFFFLLFIVYMFLEDLLQNIIINALFVHLSLFLLHFLSLINIILVKTTDMIFTKGKRNKFIYFLHYLFSTLPKEVEDRSLQNFSLATENFGFSVSCSSCKLRRLWRLKVCFGVIQRKRIRENRMRKEKRVLRTAKSQATKRDAKIFRLTLRILRVEMHRCLQRELLRPTRHSIIFERYRD